MEPAKKGDSQSGHRKSRGGLTTEIAALIDALGNLIRFVLLPRQRHDITRFDVLMAGITCLAFIGDKAFDANRLRKYLAGRAPMPAKLTFARRLWRKTAADRGEPL